ncbi:adhesion G protein-coupled receptor E3, partial [Biomphalaria glabrata]
MAYPFELTNKTENCYFFGKQHKTFLYQMLINVQDVVRESNGRTLNKCNETTWLAPHGECLQLKCTPGKTLKNGICTTIFTNVKSLVYKTTLFLEIKHWDTIKDNMTLPDLLDSAERQ